MAYKVLFCGDRDWTDEAYIETEVMMLDIEHDDLIIIEGEANGADKLSRKAAEKFLVPVEPYPADWARYKRAAGPIRNQQMLDEGKPDLVIAFHDDLENSKGTKDMVARAKKAGIPVQIVTH
jgi:hypothetical protein